MMKRFKSARGGISVGGILSLLIIAFLIYEGLQFGPVLFAQYEFKDAIAEAAKFSRGKTVSTIQDDLTKRAAELGLPVARDQIAVSMQPTKTRIQVKYQLSVDWLPGKTYKWGVDEVAESTIF